MDSMTRPHWSAKDVVVLLAYLATIAFLVYRLLDRDAGVPIIPLENAIDSRRWIKASFAIIGGLLALILTMAPIIYYKLRTGRWKAMHVTAGLLVSLVAGLLFYVPLSYVYEKSLAPGRPFHAHLQLFPTEISLPEKRDDTLVVAFLGGSTTAWSNWTSQVEHLLQAQFPDRKVIALNQGVEWYTMLHDLINYETNVRPVHADYVVVMEAINDLLVNADHSYYVNGPFRRDYGHHMGPLTRLSRVRPLFDLVADVAAHMFAWRRREPIDTDVFKGLPAFTSYTRLLVQLIQKDGSQPVVMAQPYLYKPQMSEKEIASLYLDNQNGAGPDKVWTVATARRGMEQYVGAVREVAKSEAVPLIDLEAAVPKDLKYMMDDCHYTDAGATLVAQQVSAALAQLIRKSQES
jgi:lysophospholipase L1-like esterase